jgi:hypothetical protein
MLFIVTPNLGFEFSRSFLFVVFGLLFVVFGCGAEFVPTALPDDLAFFFSLCGVFRNILDTFELTSSGNSDVIVLIFVVVIPAFSREFCFK